MVRHVLNRRNALGRLLLLLFAIALLEPVGAARADGARSVFSGRVLDSGGAPICAMVLINGQYAFSCDGEGLFEITAPLDADGGAVVFVFADDYRPFRASIGPAEIASGFEVRVRAAAGGLRPEVDVEIGTQDEASTWLWLDGIVRTPAGEPMCAMVLANGEYAFSCDGSGRFELNVPQGAGGGATLFVFADGWLPLRRYIPGETMERGCDAFSEIWVPQGLMNNNVWNMGPAGSFPWRQCLLQRGEGDLAEYGWSWSWPPVSRAVYSYPGITMGKKPWLGGASTRDDLPIRIRDIESMRVDFELETETDGEFNLAVSLWVTRTGAVTEAPFPDDILTEFMIWTNYRGMIPVSPFRGSTTIEGLSFDVQHVPNWFDASGVNTNRWSYLAYHVRTTQRTNSAALDLRAFLDDAVARGYLTPDQFVNSVEVGNEVQAGAGVSWVRSLSLEVNGHIVP